MYDLSIYSMNINMGLPFEVYEKLEYDFVGFKNTIPLLKNKNISIIALPVDSLDEDIIKNYNYVFSFRDTKVYQKLFIRIIKYPNATCVYDINRNELKIYSDDNNSIHEIAYLFILSKVGKYLDSKRIHKLHAAAIRFNNIDIVAIGKSGAGKSTLVMNLLASSAELISDDLTLFNSKLEIIAYPLRIGLPKDAKIEKYPTSKEVTRRLFGKKLILTVSEINMVKFDKCRNARRFYILHKSKTKSEISKATFLQKIKYLFCYLLIGIDTPIILEFFWESGIKDFMIKSYIFLSRLILCIKLLVYEDFYTVYSLDAQDQCRLIKENTIN